MRRLLCISLLFMINLSCSRVHEESIPPPEPFSEIRENLFSKTDSLYLIGEFQPVRDSLLNLLSTDSSLKNEALFRLLGLYHGRAMEDEFVSLLDSLEMEGSGSLTGWKVSALDLGGDPGGALVYLSPGQSVLYSWLLWEIDSLECPVELPYEHTPGDVFASAHIAVPGSLSERMLNIMAGYEMHFPSVRSTLLRELETTSDSTGISIDDILSDITETPQSELLLLRMKAAADSGSFDYWDRIVTGAGPSVCSIAVEEILQRYPEEYSPRLIIADSLALCGNLDLLLEYSGRGDPWHRTGSLMAVLMQENRYDELLQLTGSVSPGDPDSISGRAALFRAHALRGAGRPGSVYYPAYLEFAAAYPGHPYAREAAYNAGKYFDCEQEWNSAADAYLTSLRTSGAWGGDERAHWRGGFSLYMSGRFIDADSLWTYACGEWPTGYWRDEMLFWRARLAGELGRESLSDSLLLIAAIDHPWEFYGLLAARRLSVRNDFTYPMLEISLMDDSVCSLAVEMTASGFGIAAVELLSESSLGSPSIRAAALSLMGRHGCVLRLLRALDIDLRESSDEMLSDSLLSLYFPSPYRDLSSEATDSLTLDSDVLQGIMREESYFDRLVVSRAGAMGVVQLMPGTAYDVARWYGLPFLEADDYFDPFVSVPYGALYINRQYGNFGGETPLFLAAYNAGPGNASRWVDMHGWNPDDPEMYIEQITYRETRMYVKKVLRSAWIYERR
ncbi:MAG: lytic transglycosylase domain-containing protein [Candidatus Fermentibacteria bacterium]